MARSRKRAKVKAAGTPMKAAVEPTRESLEEDAFQIVEPMEEEWFGMEDEACSRCGKPAVIDPLTGAPNLCNFKPKGRPMDLFCVDCIVHLDKAGGRD